MNEDRNQMLMENRKNQREYMRDIREESTIYNKTIDTKDYEGGFHISYDERENSLLQPVFLMVPDLKTMKMLGNMDDFIEKEPFKTNGQAFRGWKEENDIRDFKDFSILEKYDLCKALHEYVYGNSKLVKSYEKALDKYYFPMAVPVFEARDIVVSKDHPLYLDGSSEQGLVSVFRTITVEAGGRIVSKGVVTLIADQYEVQGDNESAMPIIISQAVNGEKGGKGSGGDPGTKGDNGVKGTSGKDYCSTNATDGKVGNPGEEGDPGTSGTNGAPGGYTTVKILAMSGLSKVSCFGGSGGTGGDGGAGGKGGQGGDAAPKEGHCGKGNPGKGGTGGKGGKGGTGGDGGAGGTITITYNTKESPTAKFQILTADEARTLGLPTGQGGACGSEGLGGSGGDGGLMCNETGAMVPSGDLYKGESGANGGQNNPGQPGQPGKIYINGMIM